MADDQKPVDTTVRWFDPWMVAMAALAGLSVWLLHDNPEVRERAKRVAGLAPILFGGAVAVSLYQEARWFRENKRRAVVVLFKMAVASVSSRLVRGQLESTGIGRGRQNAIDLPGATHGRAPPGWTRARRVSVSPLETRLLLESGGRPGYQNAPILG